MRPASMGAISRRASSGSENSVFTRRRGGAEFHVAAGSFPDDDAVFLVLTDWEACLKVEGPV